MTQQVDLSRADRKRAEAYARKNLSLAGDAFCKKVAATMSVGLRGKEILPGDTLPKIVRRECPEVHSLVEAEGLSIELDLPENSTKNMLRGILFFKLSRVLN